MSDKTKDGNQGIIVSGNLTATNVASGQNASITIHGAVSAQITQHLEAMRSALAAADLEPQALAQAEAALDQIAEETAAKAPDTSRLQQAISTLDAVGKVGISLTALGEKLYPHLAALSKLVGF